MPPISTTVPPKPLKPFSQYTESDWKDVPVEGCDCIYCKAYKEAHPTKTFDWGMPPSHSLEVAQNFGGIKWEEQIAIPASLNISMDEAIASLNKAEKALEKTTKFVLSASTGLEDIKKNGYKFIYLIRGIPGSGKSTLAQMLKYTISKCGWLAYTYEADDFFVKPSGEYLFVPEKLGEAHSYCQFQVEKIMSEERGIVIVSNTFVYRAHLEPYLRMARKHGYIPIEIICRGNFQNVHGVPPDVMRKMKLNFEI